MDPKNSQWRRLENYHILYPILGEETERIIEKFSEKEELMMKTAQDYIREEIAEIKRQGIEEEKKKGKIEGINMIKNKVEISKIRQYTGVTEEEINKIAESI